MKIFNIVTLLAAAGSLANGENTIGLEESEEWEYSTLPPGECRHSNDCTADEYCSRPGAPFIYGKCVSMSGRAFHERKNAFNAEEVDMMEDIPSSCLNKIYEVQLKAMESEGAHFFIAAKSSHEESFDSDKCPELLVFTSIDEQKFTHSVHDIAKFDEDSSSFLLGKASLKEIMDAENSVEAIKGSEYELTSNSCVHYAGHIWRGLHLDETNELASFLIENLLKDDGLLKVARNKISTGGLRVMSYVAGKGSFKDFVEYLVYSQLNIKDGGEFAIEVN